jgi:hemerythrin superfamily protein
LSYKINFDEPISNLIERLKREHCQFESRLAELEAIDTVNSRAMSIVDDLSGPIVRHAVEEEAIVLRVIMQKAKEQSKKSIEIAQEHNWIVDFFRHKVPNLTTTMPPQQAKEEVMTFIQNLRRHFGEEEKVMFPLALKADSLHTK